MKFLTVYITDHEADMLKGRSKLSFDWLVWFIEYIKNHPETIRERGD